jgi:hypothetical protein
MLRFEAYHNGEPAQGIDLSGAYVFGQDNIPVRADLVASHHQITCMKRVPGACGLSLMWHAGKTGKYLLATTRLPERPKPYNLNLELARAQLMRLYQKREDWALFDFPEAEDLNREFLVVRDKFTEALVLNFSDPAAASVKADETLDHAMLYGEKLALFHGDILTKRRISSGGERIRFGHRVIIEADSQPVLDRIHGTFDFIRVPIPWRMVEPKERDHDYAQIDAWIHWAHREKIDVHAGPLLTFETDHLPDWLYIWERDFGTLRDLIFDHIQRIVKRYSDKVDTWHVVSGLHAINTFNLNFDQIMELTRTSCQLVKTLAPKSTVVIDLVTPWGEYYARNQRTIPPMLYADMAYQSNIKFDAFGVQILMGLPADGYYVRDLLQISGLLDEFVNHEKPVHITACQVPSSNQPDPTDGWGGKLPIPNGGMWHAPWSQRLQAEWLQAIFRLGMSKPFVESICWRDLADLPGHVIAHGGLCGPDLAPKTAYREFRALRNSLEGKRDAVL